MLLWIDMYVIMQHFHPISISSLLQGFIDNAATQHVFALCRLLAQFATLVTNFINDKTGYAVPNTAKKK